MGRKKGDILKTAFDSYTILGQIGAGGAGEVYEVRDSENSAFAAKILDPAKVTTSRLKRFKNEINFCSKNTCRNIVRVQASGVTPDGDTFYVMPLFSGTLRDMMSKGIAPPSVLAYFAQILDGVEAAHLQGVWHRDLKPENILFSASENLLVIADFGIAHFEEEELLTAVETKNNERLANFLYSAPEQRVRNRPVTGKADVYALGLLLNETFTGRVAQGTGFRKISATAPEYGYLDLLVDEMLRDDSDSRPAIDEVKRNLIARGNEFVSLQRLNSLKTEVIPESEVDDPLIRNPIRIESVDYEGGNFIFVLSAAPPPDWITAFQNPRGSWGSYLGSGPEYFRFLRARAQVHLGSGGDPQQMVNYAKSYVEQANRQYAEMVRERHRKQLAAEREQLRKAVEAEEQRRKVLASIKL
jgi:serine/threonine protein kinase